MKKFEANDNAQILWTSENFHRLFTKKTYMVSVWRDWDGNRLVKTVDGKPVAEMPIPRNWTDSDRQDGRKWRVGDIKPAMGLHLTPKVGVTFEDHFGGAFTGKTVTCVF